MLNRLVLVAPHMGIKSLLFSVFVLFFFACGSQSYEDFHKEGEALTHSLVLTMRPIQNRQDLLAARTELQNKFNKLSQLALKAQAFDNHTKTSRQPFQKNAYSDELKAHMIRLCKIPGGREILQTCQKDALIKISSKVST